MKIEEGKYYLTRIGEVVGPIVPNEEIGDYPWKCGITSNTFTDSGRHSILVDMDNDIGRIEREVGDDCNTPVQIRARRILYSRVINLSAIAHHLKKHPSKLYALKTGDIALTPKRAQVICDAFDLLVAGLNCGKS
jgi:hypothetical protein